MPRDLHEHISTKNKDYVKENIHIYEEFRNFVVNSIIYLRKELEIILSVYFLNLLQKSTNSEETHNLIRKYEGDFLNQRLIKELNSQDSLKSGKSFKIVYLSQFAYECLFSFINMKNLPFLQIELSNLLTIKIQNDPITEANYKHQLISSQFLDETLEKVNQSQVNTAIYKEDADFYQALEGIRKKKLQQLNQQKKKLITEEKFTKNSNWLLNILEKSKVSLPDIKLKQKVEWSKDFLERKILTPGSEPSILNISLTDQNESITCVELSIKASILLLGLLDSRIIGFILNPEICPKSDIDLEENSKQEKQQVRYLEFKGSESAITSLSFLYDENYFLSSTVEGNINLWNFSTNECITCYKGHIRTVWKVLYGPKGHYFASGSADCTAKLWVNDKIFPVRVFNGHTRDVMVIEFTHNCNYLISAGLDGIIFIWEISSGTKVKILFHLQEIVSSIAVSTSGLFMVSSSIEGNIIIWDLVKGKILNVFRLENEAEKKNKIISVNISFDESFLIVCSKRTIAYYYLDNLKEEENKDAYAHLFGDEFNKNFEKNNLKPLKFFDNQNNEYFLLNRFHPKNFVISVSKKII